MFGRLTYSEALAVSEGLPLGMSHAQLVHLAIDGKYSFKKHI